MTAVFAMVDEVGWGDFAAAVFVVVLVLFMLAVVTHHPPPPPPDGRVSARAMRRLLERVDRERREHPERQS